MSCLDAHPTAATMLPVSPLADFSFDYQDLYFTPMVQAPAKP